VTIPKNKNIKITRDIVPLMMDENLNHHLDNGLNRLGHAMLKKRRRMATGMR
jgi:translation initiation factor IF-1